MKRKEKKKAQTEWLTVMTTPDIFTAAENMNYS